MIADNKIRRMHRDLVLHAGPLAPCLLADDPDARAGAGGHLSRLLRNDELEAGHALEAALKGFTCLQEVEHALVTKTLVEKHGIVGGVVEEGRGREVEQNRVRVNALVHWAVPLDLVQLRSLARRHFGFGRRGRSRDICGAVEGKSG